MKTHIDYLGWETYVDLAQLTCQNHAVGLSGQVTSTDRAIKNCWWATCLRHAGSFAVAASSRRLSVRVLRRTFLEASNMIPCCVEWIDISLYYRILVHHKPCRGRNISFFFFMIILASWYILFLPLITMCSLIDYYYMRWMETQLDY